MKQQPILKPANPFAFLWTPIFDMIKKAAGCVHIAPIKHMIRDESIKDLQKFRHAAEKYGLSIQRTWPSGGVYTEKGAIQALLLQGIFPLTNSQRLDRWRSTWALHTGSKPVELYTVAFCKTCKKPVYFLNAKHRHITARCQDH